jgi:hypothetical protein
MIFVSVGSAAFAQDFRLDIEQADPESMAGGSVPLDITLTYLGEVPVQWRDFELRSDHVRRSFEFSVPEGWKDKWEGKLFDWGTSFSGPGPAPLNKGNKKRTRIYLQDYFSKITPGRHTLVILHRETETKREFTLQLYPFDENKFSKFIQSSLKKIQSKEYPMDERADAVQSVLHLSDPKLSQVYQAALKDASLASFFITPVYEAYARNAVQYESCRRDLIQYLSTLVDSRGALVVFFIWEREGLRLSEDEIQALLRSKNSDIRKQAEVYVAHQSKEKNATAGPNSAQPKPRPEEIEPGTPKPKPPPGEIEPITPKAAREATDDHAHWLLPCSITAGIVLAGVVIFIVLLRRRGVR